MPFKGACVEETFHAVFFLLKDTIMAFVAASATNGYIPQATGQVIAFVKKPEEFMINKWVQLTPVPQPTGLYSRLDRDNGVRTKDIDQYVWADGADLPSGQYFTSRFTAVEFRTQRNAVPWEIGAQAVENADLWNPKLTHMMEAISMLMTLRTKRVYNVAEVGANWSGNTATAATLGGGKWDVGTSTTPYFFKGLMAAAQAINLGTNGKVQIQQLRAIFSPADAVAIGSSAEIRDYLKGSVHARMMIEDPFEAVNSMWGLPHFYGGVELIVDTTPQVTEQMNQSGNEATTNRSYMKQSGTCIIVARPGALETELSVKSYSTIQMFYYTKVGLMQVKGEYDGWNEKWRGAVVEQLGIYLTAPMSGFLASQITN